ncbi:MAG: hypothetical protein ACI9Y7_001060 [Dokdonia sp.]|jgi:hypothetical protein
MLKKISSLGAVLNKTEQKSIEGGFRPTPTNPTHVLVCTENTNGVDCGPPHCLGVCTTGHNGDPCCFPY